MALQQYSSSRHPSAPRASHMAMIFHQRTIVKRQPDHSLPSGWRIFSWYRPISLSDPVRCPRNQCFRDFIASLPIGVFPLSWFLTVAVNSAISMRCSRRCATKSGNLSVTMTSSSYRKWSRVAMTSLSRNRVTRLAQLFLRSPWNGDRCRGATRRSGASNGGASSISISSNRQFMISAI